MINRLLAGLAMFVSGSAAAAQTPVPAVAPIQVMVVGTFHFDNPGLDYRNLEVDDVLKPRRQAEIAAIVRALSRFSPTAIGIEWRAEEAATSYQRYIAGTLPPSRDEAVQLGFAVARSANLATVHGLDIPADLPFSPAFTFAEKNGRKDVIDQITRVSEENVAAQDKALKTKGIAATLRMLNDPVAADKVHGLYREVLKLGSGSVQPGLDVTATWYRRNLGICAKLLQAAKPGDRMIVFFGAGHLTLLRQCVLETPGFVLVDARRYLPH